MIRHYLSNNNEMCYSIKTQTFSPTKHTLDQKKLPAVCRGFIFILNGDISNKLNIISVFMPLCFTLEMVSDDTTSYTNSLNIKNNVRDVNLISITRKKNNIHSPNRNHLNEQVVWKRN